MKRFQTLSVLSLAALSLLAGCGPKTGTEPGPSAGAPAPAADFKVALLTTGPVTDGGWNQSAYEGLMKIQKDLGAKVEKQESLNSSQFEDAFRDFANQGYNVIFAHGDEFGPAAAKVAKQYPKVVFVTTGGTLSAANLVPIHLATEEGTYLQGMEAAFVSKSGKGGFIGGQNFPPVKMAADAFANGAKSVNPKFTFQTTYINGWTDPVAAKAQTEAMLSSGADVIAHNCDAAAKGMFDTAGTKPGVYTFGVNADENSKAPNVLSSAVLNVPKAFADIATEVKAGNFQGHPISIGLKTGDVTLVDNPKLANVLTADQKAKIAAAAKDIEDGKIKVAP
ncbi:MAG: BMP family protein [Capsulimonas sp.]|uniref:BMP family protein n=1 Tax=Capsulimonas sp. TaxID=2494211 RepID=UPI003265ACD0